MNDDKPNPRKGEPDLRGLITLAIVLLTFGLAYIQALKGGSPTLIAPWVAAILGSTVSMYFQSKGGERMREMTREGEGEKPKDERTKE